MLGSRQDKESKSRVPGFVCAMIYNQRAHPAVKPKCLSPLSIKIPLLPDVPFKIKTVLLRIEQSVSNLSSVTYNMARGFALRADAT